MPNHNPCDDLFQALLFLHSGIEPIPQADFKALGPRLPPSDEAPYDTLILARSNLRPRGILSESIEGWQCPRLCESNGRPVASFPYRTKTHQLLSDFEVPLEEFSRDRIDFETSSIRLSCAPAGAPKKQLHLPPPRESSDLLISLCGPSHAYYVDHVVVDGKVLRSLQKARRREPGAKQPVVHRRKPGPEDKYDKGLILAHVLAIALSKGGIPRVTDKLIGELQERLADKDCPCETSLKNLLQHTYRMPELEQFLNR